MYESLVHKWNGKSEMTKPYTTETYESSADTSLTLSSAFVRSMLGLRRENRSMCERGVERRGDVLSATSLHECLGLHSVLGDLSFD